MKYLAPMIWTCAAAAIAVLAAWLAVRAIRWARKGTRGGAMLAAVAFPFPDQPPPNEQADQANRLRKDAESGDPKR